LAKKFANAKVVSVDICSIGENIENISWLRFAGYANRNLTTWYHNL